MKIGIVTFWNSEDNYGQVLQCYALQRFLRNKGHDAFLVRYSEDKSKSVVKSIFLLPYKVLRLLYMMLFHYEEFVLLNKFRKQKRIRQLENRKHPRQFSLFKNENINSTSVLSEKELFLSPPKADAYIAGSDQIWESANPVYYLQFAPKSARRIAYAPSFGGVKLNRRIACKIKNYLSIFDVITVRERQGIDVCRKLGYNDVLLVPDPTLLLSSVSYNLVARIIPNEDEYLLLYLLGNDMDFDVLNVYQWARKKNLKVKYVASQGRLDQYDKIYPNVDEWLSLIKNAKYVITNSFHGMVFSIIMNKSFVVVPLSGSFSRMNCRVYDTLNMLDLENRVYKDSLDVLLKSIDYNGINLRLEEIRNDISQKFDLWLND